MHRRTVRCRGVALRPTGLAGVAVAALAGAPVDASAHGIQGRADLPVPMQAFYWAATVVLVVSFVGLALGWRRPVLAALLEGTSRPLTPTRPVRFVVAVARATSVAVLVLVAATAFAGSEQLNANFAPIFVFVAWWIGIALVAATIGDAWRLVHPVAAVARVLRAPTSRSVDDALAPKVGMWIGWVGLVAFVWLELVYPTATDVRLLGALVVLWFVATLLAMARWGVDDVLDRVEPFAVYTGLLGRLGVVGLRGIAGSGVEVRLPVLGALRTAPVPGLVALVGVLIGSVSYDGLSRTFWWKARVANATVRLAQQGIEPADAQLAFGTAGLVVMIAAATGLFLTAATIARIVGRLPARTAFGSTAQAFAPSLVPISVAYVVAHYCSYFWFQSQALIGLVSDPFGRGWDLFGTAGFAIDYSTLTAEAIWGIQVGAIVVGHVVALVLAHDRALEIEAGEPGARGVRSQWPMLALMVAYTVGGMYFLSEGLNG